MLNAWNSVAWPFRVSPVRVFPFILDPRVAHNICSLRLGDNSAASVVSISRLGSLDLQCNSCIKEGVPRIAHVDEKQDHPTLTIRVSAGDHCLCSWRSMLQYLTTRLSMSTYS